MMMMKRIVLALAFASLTGIAGAAGISGSGSGQAGSGSGNVSGAVNDTGKATGGAALEEKRSGIDESTQKSMDPNNQGSNSDVLQGTSDTQRQAQTSGNANADSGSKNGSADEEAQSEYQQFENNAEDELAE